MKRTVLIADDMLINRRILAKILSADYELLEAENGQVALDVLSRSASYLAALVLDLTMPVMDGFQVLDAMRQNPAYANIPVIVATGSDDRDAEVRALKMGAWDYVTKPYNPDVLRFRLRNAILRSSLNLLEQLRRQAELDSLTGLYNQQKFCDMARRELDIHTDREYVLLRFDVDRFKQFNSLFGLTEGNHFLKYVAELMVDAADRYEGCVYGRMEADVFAILLPYRDIDKVYKAIRLAQQRIRSYTRRFEIITVFGMYRVTDRSLPISAMLDNATLAARTCKGSFIQTIAEYTDAMGERVQKEQEIINEMNGALQDGQFCVFYQPKYNIITGQPIGAEALVRWKHPTKGMISPGMFIPVFEKNGFIAMVDQHVWDQVCQDLRRWLDAGYQPEPVSVNISRVNLSNPNIVSLVSGLVKKYDLDPRLLQLEITESAYMDNPGIMDRIVEDFHKEGFTILMDDFGSGYSSLNTLKDIAVDILKIDMKFLPTQASNTKSEKILASVIRMADWIGMPVIVEGVETAAQRDFLRSIGCLYVQGYLYARPMPVAEYDELVCRTVDVPVHADASAAERLNELDALLSSDTSTEALLRSIGVPVAIYSWNQGKADRIRVNRSFQEVFGTPDRDHPENGGLSMDEREKIDVAFEQAVANHTYAECEALFLLPGGMARWYRMSIRYIMPSSSGHVLSAVFTEVTQAKRVESEMSRIVSILNHTDDDARRMLLVVDDDPVSRAVLKNMFDSEYDILEAEDGQEAITQLKTHADDICLMLLDMYLPDMNGAEVLAVKSQTEAIARIPVIVISAEHRESIQVDMLHMGVNDYVTKPFIPEVVRQRVLNVMNYQARFEHMVQRQRRQLAMETHADIGLYERAMGMDEVNLLFAFLTPIFDVVRLVDPADTCVILLGEDGTVTREPYTCFRVWKKDTRCENCISEHAVRCNCQMTKYEFVENNIFYVVTRPLTLLLGGETLRVALEIVSHVSDSLLSRDAGGMSVRKLMEDTRHQIYSDPLTDAYNRRHLYEMNFLHKGRPDSTQQVAFIMMDLNGFKRINDTYGHAEGDRVLVATAAILRQQVRQTDSVVRYGGDEFLVVLTGCTRDRVAQMAQRLAESITTITYGDHQEHHASVKYGVSYTEAFDATHACLDTLINQADQAMYESRRQGT